MDSLCLNLTLEFGGGAEALFDNRRKQNVCLPTDGKDRTIKDLLDWITENLLKKKPELFVQNGTVRPGILVLVNETDWELLGQLNYVLKTKDVITFISTLHGG